MTRAGDAVARVAAIVRPFGLNLVGAAAVAAYDALVPPAYRLGPAAGRTAIVVGHGGGGFWAAYRARAAEDPALAGRAHPLDDFTAWIVEDRLAPAMPGATAVLPFRPRTPPVSFVHLAEAAGLGRRSLLGVLIHPEFGPWIALRGALLVDAVARAPRPAAGFDPCAVCRERPCVAVCPAAAVTAAGWDPGRCIDHRLAHDADCRISCGARDACVYGRAHRYSPDALAHHHGRAFAVMAAARAGRGP